MKLTIYGAPRTKKNHGYTAKVRGRDGRTRRYHMPSAAWQKWAKTASIEGWDPVPAMWTIAHPINCQAIFYRDATRGDAVGYYQGLADLLEQRGVVADDRWIVSWDGSRLDKDKDNPRVEVELVSVEDEL